MIQRQEQSINNLLEAMEEQGRHLDHQTTKIKLLEEKVKLPLICCRVVIFIYLLFCQVMNLLYSMIVIMEVIFMQLYCCIKAYRFLLFGSNSFRLNLSSESCIIVSISSSANSHFRVAYIIHKDLLF